MSNKNISKPQVYGYIRVSSKDQNEARQIIAMLQQGISRKNLFIDKQSGKDFDRTHYNRLMKKLVRAMKLYKQKKITAAEAVKLSGASRSTFYQRLKESNQQIGI